MTQPLRMFQFLRSLSQFGSLGFSCNVSCVAEDIAVWICVSETAYWSTLASGDRWRGRLSAIHLLPGRQPNRVARAAIPPSNICSARELMTTASDGGASRSARISCPLIIIWVYHAGSSDRHEATLTDVLCAPARSFGEEGGKEFARALRPAKPAQPWNVRSCAVWRSTTSDRMD